MINPQGERIQQAVRRSTKTNLQTNEQAHEQANKQAEQVQPSQEERVGEEGCDRSRGGLCRLQGCDHNNWTKLTLHS